MVRAASGCRKERRQMTSSWFADGWAVPRMDVFLGRGPSDIHEERAWELGDLVGHGTRIQVPVTYPPEKWVWTGTCWTGVGSRWVTKNLHFLVKYPGYRRVGQEDDHQVFGHTLSPDRAKPGDGDGSVPDGPEIEPTSTPKEHTRKLGCNSEKKTGTLSHQPLTFQLPKILSLRFPTSTGQPKRGAWTSRTVATRFVS